jgi:carbon monoxide dehydrogenase subunit G
MYEFKGSVYINRPTQDVFDVIIDPAKQPLWQNSLESAEWTSNGPVGVGSTQKAVAKFLGRKIETELQVTDWEPPHRFSVKGLNGPYPFEITNTLEPQGEGTLLTYSSRAEFGGFFKLAEGLVGKQIKKQVDASNESLKLLMEANQL